MSALVEPTEEQRDFARELLENHVIGVIDDEFVEAVAAGIAAAEDRGARTGIGGNSPPVELVPEKLIDPTVIAPLLDANYKPLVARSAELLASAEAWKADMGRVTVADQQAANDLADILNQLAGFVGPTGEVEEARKKVKKPVFDAGKVIDEWFAGIRTRLQEIAGLAPFAPSSGTMQGALTMWMRSEADRKQAEARLEAQRLAREAAAKIEEVKQAAPEQFDNALSDAMVAEDAAAQAAQRASSAPKDLVRTTTARGTTVGLKANWVAEVVDMMALVKAIAEGKAPLDFVTTNDRVIKSAIAGEKGRRECPGLRIENQAVASRRSA